MKIAMICFSLTGQVTGEKLLEGFLSQGEEAVLSKKSRYLPDSIPVTVREWAGEEFERAEALVFIGACGIAVRSIAPLIRGKKKDPAVLVVDECGKNVISLLSGHLGGANRLAVRAAEILGAVPVVTTATDLHSCFAVDLFAKKNDCGIFCMEAAKEVSAALLAGERVGFYSEFPYEGSLPKGLLPCNAKGSCEETPGLRPEIGIAVTIYKDCRPFPVTTQVVPRAAVLGIGCRRGWDALAIKEAACESLEALALYPEALCMLASIDLKKEEPGILALAEEWGLPFGTFSGEELLQARGEFTSSAFVNQITGVDNVCERSAVLGAGQGRLIQKKRAGGGVTTALAVKEWRISFE